MSLLDLAPVRREATRDKVSAALKDGILSGVLTVGQRLPEVELTKQFQVSRAAIREALQQLAHEGLIVLDPHRGAKVVDLSAEEVDQIISVRLLLEPEAVRLASQRMNAPERAELIEAAAKLEASRGAPQEFVPLDRSFHELIWRFSGNATLQRHLTLLTSPLFSLGTILRRSNTVSRGGLALSVPGDHRRLAKLIAEAPGQAAMDAIRNHITENWSRTKAAVGKLHEQGRPSKRKGAR